MDKYPLDESSLTKLVDAFYARVRADAALGPVFNGAIAHWDEHLDKLSAFWSSVMLTSGRYKGQPVPAHLRHREAMTPEMFGRWLALWREVTDQMMQPEAASALQARAERIAESLQLAVHFRMPPDPVNKAAPTA